VAYWLALVVSWLVLRRRLGGLETYLVVRTAVRVNKKAKGALMKRRLARRAISVQAMTTEPKTRRSIATPSP
jgi:hypothetical protein